MRSLTRMLVAGIVAGLGLGGLTAFASAPTALAVGGAPSVLNVPAQYPTIQSAVNAASSGDVVLVAPGTYTERVLIAGKAITVASRFWSTGDPSYVDRTIVDGNKGYDVFDVGAGISGTTSIVGLTVRNATNGISGFSPMAILNNHVTDMSDAIDFEDVGGGVLVRGNLVDQNSDDAVDFDRNSWGTVEHNVLVDNDDDGIEVRLPTGNEAEPKSYVFRDNVIARNAEDGIQMIERTGGPSNRRTVVEDNLIQDNLMAGFSAMCCSNTTEAFQGSATPERYLVHDNTFRNNGHGIIGGDNVVALNNVLTDHDVAIKRLRGASVSAGNLFFGNTQDLVDSNTDAGSNHFANPLLATDGSLGAGSPAIDAGIAHYTVGLETVLDLTPADYVGAAPDLGAFEVGGTDPRNQAPFVSAGIDQAIGTATTATLAGVVHDDATAGPVTTTWRDAGTTGRVTFADPSALTTTATFALPGTYTLELVASDGRFTTTDRMTVVAGAVTPTGAAEARVTTGNDDAEETVSSGKVSLTSGDVELTQDGTTNQVDGLRFSGLAVPQGAHVTNATVQFTVDETGSAPTSLVIAGEKRPASAPFTTTAFDVSSRPRTVATVPWSPASWGSVGEAGANQRTPNVAAVVQEIVDQPAWTSGNALTLVVTGTGSRVAEAFEGGAARAALLHVDYDLEPPPPDTSPPTASFVASTLSGVAPLAVGFTDTSTHAPTSWAWTFGDGGTASVASPAHTFAAPGSYVVTLTATNAFGSSSAQRTVTVTTAPTTFTVLSDADSYVSRSSPTKNYATATDLKLIGFDGKYEYRPYFRFTVTGLAGPPQSATLRVFVRDGGTSGGSWFKASGPFTESTINWNNKPATTGTAIRTVGAIPTGQWLEIDVTGAITGSGTYTFGVSTAATDTVKFASRETANVPQLLIGA